MSRFDGEYSGEQFNTHEDLGNVEQVAGSTSNHYETKTTFNPIDALAEDTITEFRLLASSNSSGSDSVPRCKDLFESCPELAKAPLLENSVIAEVRRVPNQYDSKRTGAPALLEPGYYSVLCDGKGDSGRVSVAKLVKAMQLNE